MGYRFMSKGKEKVRENYQVGTMKTFGRFSEEFHHIFSNVNKIFLCNFGSTWAYANTLNQFLLEERTISSVLSFSNPTTAILVQTFN